ncbi:MAG: SDR family oxidoreductase [Geminicoccaceae bacterium]|nr:SDR family oxidoreductase [Geminicoccaceae bacterium]
MPNVLVTGASRGIGRGLAARFAAQGWQVIACARDPAAIEVAGGAVERHALDVTDPASIAGLAAELGGRPLDLLVNNAGIYGPRDTRLGSIDYAAFRTVLETNTLGPVRLTEALLSNLRAGARKTVVTVSSIMGSIAQTQSPGALIYRTSKAAVNMAMRSIAMELAPEGFTVVLVHPGWVRTDMGGPDATLDVRTSVDGLVRLIERLRPGDNGRFFGYDGGPLPW